MITVFGSINIDLIATAARLPAPGETLAGSSFSVAAGGKGANQALAGRRAGAEVRMAGAAGEDGFAGEALELLQAAGVELSPVRRVTEPTGTALITVAADGENTIVVVAGANGALGREDAGRALAGTAKGDIMMLQLEIPPDAVEAALTGARERGVTSILNIAPLTRDAARLARLADIVVANETEFALLSGADGFSRAALARLHAETGQTLIVTLGAEGVAAARDGAFFHEAGLAITPVDTVGAGDTFCGYLAAGLDQGLDFRQALRRAAVAGSLACLKTGAQPSIPVAAEVEARL